MQTVQELQSLKHREIIDSGTYIRMSLSALRGAEQYAAYSVSLSDFPAATTAEVFNELANLSRSGKIEGTIASPFTVTHTDPSLLTSYTPTQVVQLRGQSMFRQKGYLFFCLGADNPEKTPNQLVDPTRITQFYGLTMTDFFGELGRLTGDRTLTTDLNLIQVRWLPYTSPVLQTSVTTIATELDKIKTELQQQIASIAAGDYAPSVHKHAIATITGLQTALDGKQPAGNYQAAGDYVLRADLAAYQPAGSYALQSDLTAYQPKGNYQPAGDYAPSVHKHAIASITGLQTALDGKQPAGSYALQSDLAAYQPKGNYQPAGDYATHTDLAAIPKISRGDTPPSNPSKGDLWQYQWGDGSNYEVELWAWNGQYWVSPRRIFTWTFPNITAAGTVSELMSKETCNGIIIETFHGAIKVGASNSASVYGVFTLARRTASSSTNISTISTAGIAANTRTYPSNWIKTWYAIADITEAAISLALTGTPGAMQGSVGVCYRLTY